MPHGKRRPPEAQAFVVLAVAALCLLSSARATFVGMQSLDREIHAARVERKAEEHAAELAARLRGIKESWTQKQHLEHASADTLEQQSPPRFGLRLTQAGSRRPKQLRSQRSLKEYAPSGLVDPEPCDAQCQERQRSALMSLFFAWGGPGWRDRTGWGDPLVHHCSWFGVLCCAPNSSSLTPSAEYDHSLPCEPVPGPTLEDMPSVTSLKLDTNNLQGVLDAQLFGPLSVSLYVLTAAENSMHGTVPPALATALPLLRDLSMDDNQLTGTLPSELGSLPLYHLSLSFNNVSGSIPASYSNLTNLHILNLRRNRLTGALLPGHIASCIGVHACGLGRLGQARLRPATLVPSPQVPCLST